MEFCTSKVKKILIVLCLILFSHFLTAQQVSYWKSGILLPATTSDTIVFTSKDTKLIYWNPAQLFPGLYSYRIQGFQNEWSSWTAQSFLILESIPGDSYFVEIKNNRGNYFSIQMIVTNSENRFYNLMVILIGALFLIILLILIKYGWNRHRTTSKKKSTVQGQAVINQQDQGQAQGHGFGQDAGRRTSQGRDIKRPFARSKIIQIQHQGPQIKDAEKDVLTLRDPGHGLDPHGMDREQECGQESRGHRDPEPACKRENQRCRDRVQDNVIEMKNKGIQSPQRPLDAEAEHRERDIGPVRCIRMQEQGRDIPKPPQRKEGVLRQVDRIIPAEEPG